MVLAQVLELSAYKVMKLRDFQLSTEEKQALKKYCGYRVDDDNVHHLDMPDAIITVDYTTHKVNVVSKVANV